MNNPSQDRIAAANYRTLTVDCYGTLIDWEGGILAYLQPLFENHDIHVIDEFVLECYSRFEPAAQDAGGSYRTVLAGVLQRFGERLAFMPKQTELRGFANSIEHWQPFPDTVDALKILAEHFALAVVSNIDDELFTLSAKHLQVPFQHTITAEQVGVYKPNPAMFDAALKRVEGPVLHVAQSRFHDIVPATAAGLDTVWINRPSLGAAKPVDAKPTWTFTSLAGFAAAVAHGVHQD